MTQLVSTNADARELSGLRVLLVNWRDEGHPQAGGAETFCAEVGRWLAGCGADVSLFTSRGAGQVEHEVVGGVRTIRRGGRWTVYAHALRHLRASRGSLDLVVDCQNGLPFFSPLVIGRQAAVVLLIHHVHQAQFGAHFPPVLARIGQFLEGPVSRAVYRTRAVAVVSPSTRTDVRLRLRLRGPIHVVPNGVTGMVLGSAPQRRGVRAGTPTVVCVGRLVVHKRMDRLLHALGQIREAHPDLQVHIVGDGPERAGLQRLADQLGLSATVTFHGRVDAATRDALLDTAWLTVNPSMGEGWGLGVLEAAAAGVPTVAAAVPGLRDAVIPDRTGWLVPDDQELSTALLDALSVLSDEAEAARWSARCVRWASGFTWERTALRLLDVGAAEQARRWRRSAPRDRRRRSDQVTWAELQVPDAAAFTERARKRLRIDDLWQVEGERAWLLCAACDEQDLMGVVSRLGVGLRTADVAMGAQLLGALVPAEVAPDQGEHVSSPDGGSPAAAQTARQILAGRISGPARVADQHGAR